MKKRAIGVVLAVLLISSPSAMSQILSSFDPAGNQPVGIAYGNDELFVYDDFDSVIQVFDRVGNALRTFSNPGNSSNDFDLDYLDAPMTLGTTAIPAGSLLVVNGDDSPHKAYALNPADGSVLATIDINIGTTVGAAYNPLDDLIYSLDWSADLVRVFDPATGTELNNFSVTPAGASPLNVFYGDLDIDADGNLQIVTDVIEQTRILTTTGAFVQDFDLSLLSPTANLDLTGIAFDLPRGEAWVTSRDGSVYQLGGFPTPEPGTAISLIALMGIARRRRLHARA